MKGGYTTGGKKPAPSLSTREEKAGTPVNISTSGAGKGTTENQPNTTPGSGPGGYGSTGKKQG